MDMFTVVSGFVGLIYSIPFLIDSGMSDDANYGFSFLNTLSVVEDFIELLGGSLSFLCYSCIPSDEKGFSRFAIRYVLFSNTLLLVCGVVIGNSDNNGYFDFNLIASIGSVTGLVGQ